MAEQKMMYQVEYDGLKDLLVHQPALIGPLKAYMLARRHGAAETFLTTEMGKSDILLVRGKVQMALEILAICEAAERELADMKGASDGH